MTFNPEGQADSGLAFRFFTSWHPASCSKAKAEMADASRRGRKACLHSFL